MNKYLSIIKFEFIRKYRGMLLWLTFWILFILLIVAFYDSLASNTKDLEAIMSSLPQQLLKAFNIDVNSLSTIEGMINSRFTTFSIIIGGIWAGWLGAQMIGKDENTGVLVWIATQPVSRKGVYYAKLISMIAWIVITNACLMIATILLIDIFTSVTVIPIQFFVSLGIGLSIYYVFLLSLGNLGAILWNEDKGRYLAIFVVMFAYIMNVIRVFEGVPDIIKYVTTNFYFDPDKVAKTNFRESFEDFLMRNKYESSNLVFRIKDAVIGYKNFMKGMQTIKHKSWGGL